MSGERCETKRSVANLQCENSDVICVTDIEETIVARELKFWI